MEFRTVVDIEKPLFQIEPCEEILFVGSCFADAIGSRFREEAFPVAVNPYGVMYNPASILHTLQRFAATTTPAASPVGPSTTPAAFPAGPSTTPAASPAGPSTTPAAFPAGPRVAFLTLGTNHVYRLKATGEIVDNCEKRPQSLFEEEELSVEACSDYLRQCVEVLRTINPNIHVVLTVSPIRYRKYGYHESQLSKATLLLAAASASATGGSPSTTPAASPAVSTTTPAASPAGIITYFPAYELLMDELRDYRFYAPDMIHPSSQAVEYIWERLVESYFSDAAKDYLHEWHPIKQALAHKPFNPDSPEYRIFAAQTQQRLAAFLQKYPTATTPAASAVGGFPAGSPAGSSGA